MIEDVFAGKWYLVGNLGHPHDVVKKAIQSLGGQVVNHPETGAKVIVGKKPGKSIKAVHKLMLCEYTLESIAYDGMVIRDSWGRAFSKRFKAEA